MCCSCSNRVPSRQRSKQQHRRQEDMLNQRFSRAAKKDDLSTGDRELLLMIRAKEEEMTEEQHTKRAATAFLQRLNEEHEEWCGLRFSSLEGSKRPPELQEKYPYPGLVNLGDTCYLNAVCQVLLHCDAARIFLRSGAEVGSKAPRRTTGLRHTGAGAGGRAARGGRRRRHRRAGAGGRLSSELKIICHSNKISTRF